MSALKASQTSPLEIEILLYYWWSPNSSTDFHNLHAPADKEAVARFLDLGLLVHLSEGEHPLRRYGANREALEPWVDAITSVPLPVRKWVVPEA